ncbi:hypothetical protein [Pantoea agglomerans]|uniref:hypothetical protein n=1 Tax=Enterobacter agglomerans TaxID=549 RepID=UPI001786170B|nr:hypothetical protein [Pantoea agglomerans]MBD8152245.1 hypothetical protein [Pantoea agglomerans]MBD8231423.1 hypothetical protein [Pantoea agglomerans]
MGKNADWEKIKRSWCAGVTARELAKEHEVSHTAINKRAKKEGWVKVSTVVSIRQKVSSGNLSENHGKASNGAGSEDVSPLKNTENTAKTKRNRRSGNPHPTARFKSQNRASMKHGGYARRLLTSDANLEDAAALTLEDELLRVRAANLEAAENIGRYKTQLTDADDETQKRLLAQIESAGKAMDRNTARIESLVTTLAQAGRTDADTALKRAVRNKAEFELEREKELAPLEYRRCELVNQKIQAEIDKADPESESNVTVVYHALQIPGAIQLTEQ